MNRRYFLGAILAAACPPMPMLRTQTGFVPWSVYYSAANLNALWMQRIESPLL